MPLPDPTPGLVVSYAYLWNEEHRRGREEGVKDRPCVIVLSTAKDEFGAVVTVVPVTHSPPVDPESAVELPGETKRRLGLDSERSWAIVSEVNRFRWPGPDLRPIPNSDPPRFSYGILPAKLFLRIRQTLIDIAGKRGAAVIRRTD